MSGTPEHIQIWQQGQDFDPRPVSEILGINEKRFKSHIHGAAFRWHLKSSRNPAFNLDFFYKSSLLNLGMTLGSGDYQPRLYLVESIATDTLGSNRTLSFFCVQLGISTRVTVYPEGGVDENHRFGQGPIVETSGFSVPIREIDQSSLFYNPRSLKQAVSVQKAADSLGCTESYVRQLAQTGRLAAEKIGRDWYIDLDALAKFPKPKSPRSSFQ